MYGPWRYQVIPKEEIAQKLALYAYAKEHSEAGITSVTFQPCLNEDERSQDRRIVHTWPLKNGIWKFIAILDGHAGHDTVDYTVEELPRRIKFKLEELIQSVEGQLSPQDISSALQAAISELDVHILDEFASLFPGGIESISQLSAEEIDNIINDGGERLTKVHRCMRGTTALVAVIDPAGENLWIANLGDCEAVLGESINNNRWQASRITSPHNGDNAEEVQRVREQHLGEEECILNKRVLGAIAVTRAIGDFAFKVPISITRRVFLEARPGFTLSTDIERWLPRNLTPPYLSNKADVFHHKIIKESTSETSSFLIMYSDGLTDPRVVGENPSIEHWVNAAGKAIKEGRNAALEILKEAIGGEDDDEVSQYLMLESTDSWMDDITIAVVRL
ncbi:hypothetical protein M422DRAFT_61926 [Sphaerobolus stellatus SS14]|uniref:PPM-type phosphatase domain-containing protein n=1 Tax=Sphaerobolus stellatus (strain SS14) TaxID=990650 RepID=A0A0C9TG21_SPHS4|nr:hypothetical protein M422DRAFT_61926 [Sphaerobolus stellatus SS14]